jgi:hypothetical protein
LERRLRRKKIKRKRTPAEVLPPGATVNKAGRLVKLPGDPKITAALRGNKEVWADYWATLPQITDVQRRMLYQADQPPPSQQQQTKTMTPQERFAARVEKLRAAGDKKPVDIASPQFHITPRTGYRWLAELKKKKLKKQKLKKKKR